ncbi:SDR family oxidoreductase [Ramlibacter sp. 2FC]|uniref:SDR family NAD(P)-dependent oxidoreductase n=1 Tax=Ramlibacter sp. 2FC TaxID=2502188 RepID=UPI0010F93D3F|nr:SDR family oxidoreductase [Ramlibacter sp. 2FC]
MAHTQTTPPPANRLQGRRIVITGAASGIGRATAELFAAEGAALTLMDLNNEGLQQLARTTGAFAFEADITDEASVERAVQQGAAAMGGIDGVVNAAGVLLRGSVLEVGLKEWRRVLDINITGTYLVVRCCLPWLKQVPGSTIVNLGSAQSLLPNAPNRTAYATSKGGVLNLTRALAAELAPDIRANTVCPGLVETPMTEEIRGNVNNYALRRLGQPLEVARSILFLTTSESSYVTGAALAVDGGRSFH